MNKVSIITPCFNSKDYINETYQSLESQTHEDWEWIVVDDCSTDSSFQVLTQLMARDPRVRIYKNATNSGAAITRNNSLEHAQGKYLAFLDCDDLWMPTKLEEQIQFMKKENIEFSYHDYEIVNETGEFIKSQNLISEVTPSQLLKYNPFATSSIMMTKSIADKFSLKFKEHLRRRQDYIFWYEAISASKLAKGLNKNLSKYRISGKDSLSSNKVNMAKIQWMLLRSEFGLNTFKRIYYFLHYACHGIKKYFL